MRGKAHSKVLNLSFQLLKNMSVGRVANSSEFILKIAKGNL